MKKLFVITLLFILASGCQQKQEPKGQAQNPQQFPLTQMQTSEEIKRLEDAIRKNPHDIGNLIRLGNVMMDTSRFNDAIDIYQNVLVLDGKNIDVRVDLATCYRAIGKFDMAVKEYRRALEINPNHLNAHRNLGVVLAYDLKDRPQAIKELEKYLAIAPSAPDSAQIRQLIDNLKAGKS